jgi:hypothetical protein
LKVLVRPAPFSLSALVLCVVLNFL